MLSKKSIVLNGVSEKDKRAVLSLECDGEMASGSLRLYNFGTEPRGIISLGIYHNNEVIKAGLTHKGGMLFNFSCNLTSIPTSFSCAVVNFLDGEPKPILYGNSDGYGGEEMVFNEVISSLSKAQNISDVENILDRHEVDYEDNLKEEIENNIDLCLREGACSDCENCQYKKFYYNSFNLLNEDKIDEKIIQNEKFYIEMKPQIDELFANNPSEDYLENLIPNSKWVKVSLESGEDYYVLGLIYEENNLKYICYGVPGVFQKNAPRELSGYPVWFPLDEERPQGFGYWLSYQDADSGESVKAVVV